MNQSAGPTSLRHQFKVEVDAHKKVFEDKCFELNHAEGTLKIFNVDHDFPTRKPTVWKEIELNFISQARDVSKARPKVGICFCITNAGDQIFVQADSVDVMKLWIEELNKASKIVVPNVPDASNLRKPNTRQEVAGGVLVPVETKAADTTEETPIMPALSLPCILSGYAVKQGGLRKNWKKRYFVLTKDGLSYYKDDQEKEPIKAIPIIDMKRARHVKGEHHPHRTFMFEVITETRTFNVQCEEQTDCDKWVDAINTVIDSQPLFQEVSSTTDEVSGRLPMEQETTKYTFKESPKLVARDKQQLIDTSKQSYARKRTSEEEETISSHSVWTAGDSQAETVQVDRRSKSGLKGFSRKNWALW